MDLLIFSVVLYLTAGGFVSVVALWTYHDQLQQQQDVVKSDADSAARRDV